MSTNLQKHLNPSQAWLIDMYHREIDKIVNLLTPASLLDVGSGEGFTLKRHNGAVGVDYSMSALRYGQQNFGLNKLTQADIYRLPFPADSFEVVLCLETLEHLHDPQAALDSLIGVSGRWVVVSVPLEPIFRGLNFLRGRHWSRWGNHPEHVQNWSKQGFLSFLGQPAHDYKIVGPWQIAVIRKGAS